MQSGLLFTTSPWFTLLCVVVGVLYAWLLYSPVPTWSKSINWALAGLRGLLVSILCFLLLAPRVRTIDSLVDKAKVVLAIDNSASMEAEVDPSMRGEIAGLQNKLTEAGYDVTVATLGGENTLDSVTFETGSTNLGGFLSMIRSDFEGQNLTDVVLVSDGIVNQGTSPAFGVYPFKIHSVAVGDTVPVKEIQIAGLRANQVAFLGNQFPIQADISAYGMDGQQATVTLKQGQKVVATKQVKVSGERFFEAVDFFVSSAQPGMQRFTVAVETASGRQNQDHRERDIYVDIIDGRESVLLLALSPHPDLKALRSVFDKNENYELDVHILSLGQIPGELLKKKYDLMILHQVPDAYNLSAGSQVASLLQKDTPVWFFYGNQSSLTTFNRYNQNVSIKSGGAQNDYVTGKFNKAFNTIVFDPAKFNLLEKLAPVSVPFGDYTLNPGAEVVLYQRLGSLDTQKPLLTINISSEAKKTASFLGDGLWHWRQEEYLQTGKTDVVDEMVEKVVQLLAIKEDKRKFRVTPVSSEFSSREAVVLQTEVYNETFEKIFGNEITLKLTNEGDETSTYTYVNVEGEPHFRISGLEEGAYRYTASTVIKGKTETAAGRFLVRDVDLEGLNMTANHGMLREVSLKTGGAFLYPDGLGALAETLASEKSPDRLNASEEVVEIIHLKWLFFLLILLASIEWASRRYLGGY